jgi:NADP-dependent aldehyde dehydrogenase
MTENDAPSASLTGQMIIAGSRVTGHGEAIRACDPAADRDLEPQYFYGDVNDVDAACAAASEAFHTFRSTSSAVRAEFLEAIATNIEARKEALIARACTETGLPRPRISGEVGRTAGQLRLFAQVLREGGWNGARIDPSLPDRSPLPRADIRQRKVPLGPVAVFGASNFPLAFSVAGGDTASALAAGCPVVVKAHDAHPGTSELVGHAIVDAIISTGMPSGTFSMLFGTGPGLGVALVTDPRIKAVGFTGSRSGGTALVSAAAARSIPIPVYAEMSSINPVFILANALRDRGAELATVFVESLTLGSGQLCTNPGLVITVDGPGLDNFIQAASSAVAVSTATPMLSPTIASNYAEGVNLLASQAQLVAQGAASSSANGCRAALFVTDAATFSASDILQREVFGSSSLVVRCTDAAQVRAIASSLEGQLTATVHCDEGDLDEARALLPILELQAGRILFNGWPTGVEVGHAMVHGGPYPATSDARTTSVGSLAIERFLRPVAYQDVPPTLLPSAIADGNPDGLWRLIDGCPAQR